MGGSDAHTEPFLIEAIEKQRDEKPRSMRALPRLVWKDKPVFSAAALQ
ncbi:hypothetical protein EI42_03674 [Thermosporothrix hazakensis]|jgi:hypothetical protein|uniref:Uncharacterized protein n=1 Tax=Thermosporothrix hazakensis TaxID=644383 RepID=A0A326UD65_THEHA|nr:hypothetical protein EI42_03674 [Thermosporothrix hazakensis]